MNSDYIVLRQTGRFSICGKPSPYPFLHDKNNKRDLLVYRGKALNEPQFNLEHFCKATQYQSLYSFSTRTKNHSFIRRRDTKYNSLGFT